VPVYGAAHAPPEMLSAPVRVRCVARKVSAAVMMVVALPASHPTLILRAESSAAWSASCWSWFFCHSAIREKNESRGADEREQRHRDQHHDLSGLLLPH